MRFALLEQQLLELIRAGRAADALAFGQDELAPLAAAAPARLRALERAACLLDIATLPGSEKTWESVRPELAERYSEAGMSDFSAFVSPDETFG